MRALYVKLTYAACGFLPHEVCRLMALKSVGNWKGVLRPTLLRQVPEQFSWVDQGLV